MTVHYVVEGEGPPLVLSGSLGTTHEMWDPNVGGLATRFRIVRYDHPGHGASPSDPSGFADLARTPLALADELGIPRFTFCGISLGGMIGIWLGAHAPDRIERLVLACTAPHFPPREQWLERAAVVRERGVEAVADTVVGRWFTPRFNDSARWRAMLASTPAEGYARCCEAIADTDLRAELERINVRTTVILGRHDPVVSDENKRLLAAAGETVELDAAHLASVEQPEAFNSAVLEG